jgi:hypothetical protein
MEAASSSETSVTVYETTEKPGYETGILIPLNKEDILK